MIGPSIARHKRTATAPRFSRIIICHQVASTPPHCHMPKARGRNGHTSLGHGCPRAARCGYCTAALDVPPTLLARADEVVE